MEKKDGLQEIYDKLTNAGFTLVEKNNKIAVTHEECPDCGFTLYHNLAGFCAGYGEFGHSYINMAECAIPAQIVVNEFKYGAPIKEALRRCLEQNVSALTFHCPVAVGSDRFEEGVAVQIQETKPYGKVVSSKPMLLSEYGDERECILAFARQMSQYNHGYDIMAARLTQTVAPWAEQYHLDTESFLRSLHGTKGIFEFKKQQVNEGVDAYVAYNRDGDVITYAVRNAGFPALATMIADLAGQIQDGTGADVESAKQLYGHLACYLESAVNHGGRELTPQQAKETCEWELAALDPDGYDLQEALREFDEIDDRPYSDDPVKGYEDYEP